MLKSVLDFVRYYFLTYKNHLILSAFKFVLISWEVGGGVAPEPPIGDGPLEPPPLNHPGT